MSLFAHHIDHVKDPGPMPFSPLLRGAAVAAVGLGGLLLVMAFISNADRAWQALLLAYHFFLMLGLGGMVFTAIQYVTNARWSIVVRRMAENTTAYLPISFLVFLVIAVGGFHTLFALDSPLREAVGKGGLYYGDELKKIYMSQTGVIVKGAVFYALWIGLSILIRSNSVKADSAPDEAHKQRNVRLSIIFLLVFGFTYSLHVVDMLMALEGRWFSTIFGVYCFTGLFLCTLALLTVATHAARLRPQVAELIQRRHIWDLGTWMMAFSCFTCYIMFSQYMLIWYANLPETNFFFIDRARGGWQWVMPLLPILKWVVPFLVMKPTALRANVGAQLFVCAAIFAGQLIDLYIIIYPVFSTNFVVPGAAEIGALVALLGVFGLSLDWAWRRASVMAVGDPHVVMSVNGSYL